VDLTNFAELNHKNFTAPMRHMTITIFSKIVNRKFFLAYTKEIEVTSAYNQAYLRSLFVVYFHLAVWIDVIL